MSSRWKKRIRRTVGLLAAIVSVLILIVRSVAELSSAKQIVEAAAAFIHACRSGSALELSALLGVAGVLLLAGGRLPLLRKLTGEAARYRRGLGGAALISAMILAAIAVTRHGSRHIVTAFVREPRPSSSASSPPNGVVPPTFSPPAASPMPAPKPHNRHHPVTRASGETKLASAATGQDKSVANVANYTPAREPNAAPTESSSRPATEASPAKAPVANEASPAESPTSSESASGTTSAATSGTGEASASASIDIKTSSSSVSVSSQSQSQSQSFSSSSSETAST